MMINETTTPDTTTDVASPLQPIVRPLMKNAELDPLVTALSFLRKLYVAMELDDYGNIVIPHSVYDDCGEDIMAEIGKLERVIAAGITGKVKKVCGNCSSRDGEECATHGGREIYFNEKPSWCLDWEFDDC